MKHEKRRMLGSMEENSCRFGVPNSIKKGDFNAFLIKHYLFLH